MWASAFPDGSITVDRVTAAGETVVVEFQNPRWSNHPLWLWRVSGRRSWLVR
jgi:hypothetical protein